MFFILAGIELHVRDVQFLFFTVLAYGLIPHCQALYFAQLP